MRLKILDLFKDYGIDFGELRQPCECIELAFLIQSHSTEFLLNNEPLIFYGMSVFSFYK